MALDQAYFDSIQIDIVKKKYYNANKVKAVFDDIRMKAAAIDAENQELKARLGAEAPEAEGEERSVDALQRVYRSVLDKARQRADEIVNEAEAEAEKIRTGARETIGLDRRSLTETEESDGEGRTEAADKAETAEALRELRAALEELRALEERNHAILEILLEKVAAVTAPVGEMPQIELGPENADENETPESKKSDSEEEPLPDEVIPTEEEDPRLTPAGSFDSERERKNPQWDDEGPMIFFGNEKEASTRNKTADAEASNGEERNEMLQDLEDRISRLAREIASLEGE